MSSHGDQLKYALGIGGLVSLYGIASLAVWFLGPSLGLGITEQIIIIALILLTWPLVILINHFRRKRAARRAEAPAPGAEAKRSVEQAKAAAAPARVYEELMRNTEEAVQWLRSTRLGGAKSGDAVYALPWFLVAGPPGSGKTSLLLSSGLDFHTLPSQRRAEQKIVRPTRHCEWRVTDSAVLLDTSGRYQNEGPAGDEWAALTETIRRYREDRPLDGLIIAVNAEKVLRASEAEIEQQAKILRARLDDVMRRAKTRFPVYLVFTHADALEGFKDFFSASHADGRAEVWGATIPLEKSANAHALFDVEFDYLYDSLMRRRLLRLAAQAPPDQQLRIFDLPLRFGDARGKLGLYTSALFRPNPFSESPLLRGFYFTANVTNGGAPHGLGADEASGDGDERPVRAVGEGYFTEKFFKEVLLRDKDLAASFQAHQKRPPRLRNVLLIVAAVLLLALTAGAIVSFFGNRALIAEATERGARVDAITRADVGKDPLQKDAAAARVEVEAVEELRETLVQLDEYDRESPPLHLRFGLYSGDAINPYLRTIYFDSIEQRFKKPTVAALERDLRAFASGSSAPSAAAISAGGQSSTEEENLGRHYDLLKAYLMLSDAEKVEPTFLANQLEEYWKRFSPPDMEIVSQQQLDFFARQAGHEDAPHIKVDDKLVAEVRRKLVAYPPVNRFYKRITTEINSKAAPINLETILEGRGRGVLASTYTVPGSFTIEGYRNHMRAAIETAAEEISKDDWVMGAAASTTQAQSTDISKLQSMYLRDYTDQWRKFLKGISVQQFKTKDDAVEALRALSATDSPMERVMTEVARNTNLSARPESRGFWGWIKGLFSRGGDDDTGGSTEVEKEFRPLFQFVSGEAKKESSPMSQYRAELRRVLEPLEGASADQLTQTSKALLTGKDDIGLQKAEQSVSNLLEGFKTAAAVDAAALLKQPLSNVRALLYGSNYEQIVKTWGEQVYPKARALESGFPFTDAGESSLTDLARFLNPVNGQLTAFFNNQLASSFEDAQGQWRLKESGAFRFSDDFVRYLNGARRLREALFPNGGQQPEVSYDITLQPVAETDITIDIDGTRVETRGTSAQSAKFIWPARAGSSGAKITVISGGQTTEKTFPGEWGLFKMFAAGSPNKTGDNQYALSWSIGSVQVRATLR
ncbi:MAG TPA: type VI secretion system membrane subunit TssM, partial [Pyrinomonadaceae bacterium]|nr:type VI secretion system membrane subunit TssM [Pyrinomonadaceae bacterium]